MLNTARLTQPSPARPTHLAEITTLEGYTNWMRDLFGPVPDGKYELKGWGADSDNASVLAFAVFKGTQTGPGPVAPPTGNTIAADYVYCMKFEGDKVSHMTKIWNDGHSLKQLGWA